MNTHYGLAINASTRLKTIKLNVNKNKQKENKLDRKINIYFYSGINS
ncbi:hypothetical protein ESCAB7627_3222 [Escherichia albertii TW07627]|uniref:Uncharacterized protein n=1 Tax=Escherichia albertii (strain TW07627) TaxID=502347 RepID=A0ABC9NML5_ESCAT|nr:hypothetical protein ESCAB7627_3222 [Escherichia albertii TW07627]